MPTPANITERGTDGIVYTVPTPASQPGDVFPAGAVLLWPGSSAPTGWALVKGQALSRTTYPNTFANCTMCGTGDGSTTFTLPDMSDQVPVGASGTRALGSTGGEATHLLSAGEMPVHGHGFSVSVSGSTDVQGNHNHYTNTWQTSNELLNEGAQAGSTQFQNRLIVNTTNGILTSTGGAHSHNVSASGSGTTNNAGSGAAHNNMQPYVAWNYIIRLY